jgi:signal transduction histidine kinase
MAAPIDEQLAHLRDENLRLAEELEETNRGVVALYAELEDKAEQLRQASELKSRFLSNVSHEFRTPLGSIIALAGLLLDGGLDAEGAKQARYIRQAARDLSSLVEDLLDLARVEAGKTSIQLAPFELDDLFRHLRGTLDPLVDPGRVPLVFEEPADIPPLVSDELRLGQIVRNFVSNALKFTEQGVVTVRASLRDATDVPPTVRRETPADVARMLVIEVHDTGIGIATPDLGRIFEEFVQVEGPLQARVKGTGLGLPLARRLAALLGGGVWVTSTAGVGSTFAVAVPFVPGTLAGDGTATLLSPASAADRILVIDDDEIVRYVVAGVLAPLHRPVVTAPDGLSGLAAATAHPPAIIVLDLEMADLHGRELLRRLRETPATAGVPVVIHTGRDLPDDERELLLGQAQAFVTKSGASEGLPAAVSAPLGGGA